MPRKGVRSAATLNGAASPASFDTLDDALAAKARAGGRPSGVWHYQNSAGKTVGAVVRWDARDGKTVLPFSLYRNRWVNKAMAAPRPLYRLAEVNAAGESGRIYVTEGEKTADALRTTGLTATTSAGGSNSASKTDWSPLQGNEVVVLIDHDAAGERYGSDVAARARGAGATSVRIVRLAECWPEMPIGGDLVDLVDEGGPWNGLTQGEVRSKLDAIADEAAAETPEVAEAISIFRPFPVDALPSPLDEFVIRTATALGCDPAMVAVPALGVLAGCVGSTRVVIPKSGWEEPLVIWCMVIAPSGSLKSPAIDAALRPVREMQRLRIREHQAALEEYREAKGECERGLREWRKARQKEPPIEPMRPSLTRYLASDFTVEALVALLVENPRGVLLAIDELARLFRGLDRYRGGRGGDLQALLEMHRAGAVVVDRKGSDPPMLFVPHAAVSIVGGIQPGVARKIFQGEYVESGLAGRFLVAAPPIIQKSWTEELCPRPVLEAYGRLCARLLELELCENADGNVEPVAMRLTPGARKEFAAFYESIAARQAAASSDAVRSALAKLEGAAARLAGLIHLVSLADESQHQSNEPISTRAMLAAIRIAVWFENEAVRFCEQRAETENDRLQRELVEWIARGSSGRRAGAATVRELTKGVRRFRGKQGDAAAALDALVSVGLADWDMRGGAPGRPARRIVLRDTVPVTETALRRVERPRSGDGDIRGRTDAAA